MRCEETKCFSVLSKKKRTALDLSVACSGPCPVVFPAASLALFHEALNVILMEMPLFVVFVTRSSSVS